MCSKKARINTSRFGLSPGFKCRPWTATEPWVALDGAVGFDGLRWSSLPVGDDAWAAFLPKLDVGAKSQYAPQVKMMQGRY